MAQPVPGQAGDNVRMRTGKHEFGRNQTSVLLV